MAIKKLERPQFNVLAQNSLPIYFSMQTALPAVLALTFPGTRLPLGTGPAGLSSLLDGDNRWSGLVPLATMFVTGLLNLVVLLPATRRIRKLQELQGKCRKPIVLGPRQRRAVAGCLLTSATEKKDGKKPWDPAPHSQEMMGLKKKFGVRHGISSLLNMANILMTIVYGINLSARL